MVRSTLMLIVVACATACAADEVQQDALRQAVEKALPLIQSSATEFTKHRDCFSCHHQALPVFALTTAGKKGFSIDQQVIKDQVAWTAQFLKKNEQRYLEGQGQGGQVDTAGYALWTLSIGDYASDELTTAVCHYLLVRHADLDHWAHTSDRPPSEASDFTTTFLAVQSLAKFANTEQQMGMQQRLEQARTWLQNNQPPDTEDMVFRLRALVAVGADEEIREQAISQLLAAQREDGGWAQKVGLESDPYATGSVLAALHDAGRLGLRPDHLEAPKRSGQRPNLLSLRESYINDQRIQRGLKWLIDHQQSDGSWHVTSRSKPFQEYFETGFPHGADQFISMSATCWSLLAIMAALPDENAAVKPQQANDDQQKNDITAILDQQVTAWNAGDLEKFMDTYWHSDELSFSSGGQITRGWQATFDRYKERYPDRQQMGTLKISQLEITLLGESAAMVLGNWRLEREMDHPHGNFTLVLRKIDGNWRIIHDHTSRLEEESEKNADSIIRRFEQLGATPIRDNTRLIGFRFDETKVSDADLQGIEVLRDLTDLSFERTAIGDEAIEHLRELRELEWLNLYHTQITDAGLKMISAMPAIRLLPIGETRVTDKGLEHVAQMKRLRYLGLRGDAITDAGLAHLRDLRLLEGLHLGETQITDDGVQNLASLTGLRELYLQKTKISDRSVDVLVKMSGLGQLVLFDTQVTADGIARLREALPKCQIITESSEK